MTKRQFLVWPYLRVLTLLLGKCSWCNVGFQRREILPLNIIIYVFLIAFIQTLNIDGEYLFQWWGLQVLAGHLFFLCCFIYFLEKTNINNQNLLLTAGIIVEVWTVFYVIKSIYLHFANDDITSHHQNLIECLTFGLETFVLFKVLFIVSNKNIFTAKGATIAYLIIFMLPQALLVNNQLILVHEDYSSDNDDEGSLWDVKYDQLFYSQESLLNKKLSKVKTGTDKKRELFYLNVASYASQDVFINEVNYIQNLFDNDFKGYAQGLNLVNNEDTYKTAPLAIRRNIRLALNGLAEKMNEEDLLFLYLTSHGGKNHKLSMRFYPFELTDLDAIYLKNSLDESNIHWKIIVISACYSGGMIDDLKDANSIIFTAASATKTSFGCADDREFTYFGEAIFKNNMTHSKHILTVFEDAITTVKKRETEEGLEPSEPQLWIGENIKKYIHNLTFDQ